VKGNSEQLKVLNNHCGEIGRTIVAALRGKSEENISKHLKDSLDRLARYHFSWRCPSIL
jgi:hypothetical protein